MLSAASLVFGFAQFIVPVEKYTVKSDEVMPLPRDALRLLNVQKESGSWKDSNAEPEVFVQTIESWCLLTKRFICFLSCAEKFHHAFNSWHRRIDIVELVEHALNILINIL